MAVSATCQGNASPSLPPSLSQDAMHTLRPAPCAMLVVCAVTAHSSSPFVVCFGRLRHHGTLVVSAGRLRHRGTLLAVVVCAITAHFRFLPICLARLRHPGTSFTRCSFLKLLPIVFFAPSRHIWLSSPAPSRHVCLYTCAIPAHFAFFARAITARFLDICAVAAHFS